MDTKEAKHWGLVNEVVNKKDLLKRAWEVAEKISNGPNLIYSSIKEVLRETENEKEIPSFKILRSLETVKKVYGSQDLKEGASSFVKKTDHDNTFLPFSSVPVDANKTTKSEI